MLTRPLTDIHCLTLAIHMVLELLRNPEIRAKASKYRDTEQIVEDIRDRPQLDDGIWVLPSAPRLPCFPPMRVRFDPPDPACGERSLTYLVYAEAIDPETPRTLMTVQAGRDLHVLPVEYGEDGPEPVILDPRPTYPCTRLSQNLSHAKVAQFFGYAQGQPSPLTAPMEWAQLVAEREGIRPRNSGELLRIVEQYAPIYPGGRQGLHALTEQLADIARSAARDRHRNQKTVKKTGQKAARDAAKKAAQKAANEALKTAGKVGKEAVKGVAEEYTKRPTLGQLLRAAVVGYGGPVAVVAIDVVENRLNKRGYTLGSLAESRDTDIFAFK